jgi:hypothetical protein
MMMVNCVTLVGVLVGIVVGIAGLLFGVNAIRTGNSIRRAELITKIYHAFLEDDLYLFYARIRNGEAIDSQQEHDERLMNKSLTLFDEIGYLIRQGLLHNMAAWWSSDAWEYFAIEIQYFADNLSVWDYMVTRIEKGLERGFPKEIIPFTGFRELLNSIPMEFQARPFPRIPEKHRAFFAKLDS